MVLFVIGIIAFICFFLYDINSVLWQKRIFHYNFGFGFTLIVFATIFIVLENAVAIQPNWILLGIAIGVASLFLMSLIYTLFFALPFKTTYVDTSKQKHVYAYGVYALCRHPGFWCFTGLYLFLYIIVPSEQVAIMAFLLIGCNFLYVVFQDRWTFPKTFTDYDQYTDSTPFLVPNLSSIRKCIRTIENKKGAHNEFKK